MLSGYRALDLTDQNGYLCGRVLADLNVDVIKVEPPGGDPGRRIGPFYRDVADREESLYWYAYNLGKRGITLRLDSPVGRELFLDLVKTADFVIESFPVGHMRSLGLGYEVLQRANPGLIMGSITGFGQTGPYSDFEGPDIVVMGMGGLMYLTGDSDRPPVRISFPTAYLLASLQAAAGMLIALEYRERTRLGQHVDVSAQESCCHTLINSLSTWELNGILISRAGPFWCRAGGKEELQQRVIWPCRDGSVAYMIMGGRSGVRSNRSLTEWMENEGIVDEFLRSIDWETFDMATASQEFYQKVEEIIGRFFMSHKKAELYEEATKRGIFLQPVADTRDILESSQLGARDFWIEIDHPELDRHITYPGPFVKASEDCLKLGPRATLIGEHNRDIFVEELGMSGTVFEDLKRRGII